MTLFDLENHDEPAAEVHHPLEKADNDSEAARWFMSSPEIRVAPSFDRDQRGQEADEIRLVFRSRWPDFARTMRAFEKVERELRRCAAAWGTVCEEASSGADEWVLTSPAHFVDELLTFPTPAGGALTVAASTFDSQIAVLTVPELLMHSVLTEWPTSTLVYAAASLARPGEWRWHEHRPWPPGNWDDSAQHLRNLAGYQGEATHGWHLRHWRQLKFRPVSDLVDPDSGRRSGGLSLSLHRSMTDGRQDLIELELGLSL